MLWRSPSIHLSIHWASHRDSRMLWEVQTTRSKAEGQELAQLFRLPHKRTHQLRASTLVYVSYQSAPTAYLPFLQR